jgi:hypothetical protein
LVIFYNDLVKNMHDSVIMIWFYLLIMIWLFLKMIW